MSIDLTNMNRASRQWFQHLASAIEPFKAGAMPKPHPADRSQVRIHGCLIALGEGRDAGKFRFGFLAKGDNVVTVDIVVRDLMADPKEYIGNMLEAINQGLQQMEKDVRIIVPPPNTLRRVTH